MSGDASFDELMARLGAGEADAAREVFDRYAARLIALARTRLGEKLRRKVDAEDVLQSVYKSFFVRHAQGGVQAQNWEALWRLLTVITLRKCGRWVEYFHAGRRSVTVEEAGDSRVGDVVAREPAPDEAAMLTETIERLLRDLEGREREIVTLGLQGLGAAEIATQVGRTRRTVERVLARLKARLEREG
jgi:RNA polymerase sigma-70 factor, ECF subfamily